MEEIKITGAKNLLGCMTNGGYGGITFVRVPSWTYNLHLGRKYTISGSSCTDGREVARVTFQDDKSPKFEEIPTTYLLRDRVVGARNYERR
mgnify:CR=1 FL=1